MTLFNTHTNTLSHHFQALESGYATSKAYFDVAIEQMNKIVHEGLDPDLTFELTFVLSPQSVTEMSWFFDYSATTAEQLVRSPPLLMHVVENQHLFYYI